MQHFVRLHGSPFVSVAWLSYIVFVTLYVWMGVNLLFLRGCEFWVFGWLEVWHPAGMEIWQFGRLNIYKMAEYCAWGLEVWRFCHLAGMRFWDTAKDRQNWFLLYFQLRLHCAMLNKHFLFKAPLLYPSLFSSIVLDVVQLRAIYSFNRTLYLNPLLFSSIILQIGLYCAMFNNMSTIQSNYSLNQSYVSPSLAIFNNCSAIYRYIMQSSAIPDNWSQFHTVYHTIWSNLYYSICTCAMNATQYRETDNHAIRSPISKIIFYIVRVMYIHSLFAPHCS